MRYILSAALLVVLLVSPVFAGEKPAPPDLDKIKSTVAALSSADNAVAAKAEADLENASSVADTVLKDAAVNADDALAGKIFKILEKRGTLAFQASWDLLNLPEYARGKYYFWKLTTGTKEEKIDSLWALWSWERVSDKMYEPVLKIYKESKNDLKAKRAAIQVLALLKNPAAIPVFVEAANISDNAADKATMAVRTEAVNGLGNIPTPESADALKKILAKDKKSPLTGAVILALGRFKDLDVEKEIISCLKSGDTNIQVSAMRAMLDYGMTNALGNFPFATYVNDNDAAIRAWMAFALFSTKNAKPDYFLEKAKAETDPKTAFIRDLFRIAAFRIGGDVPLEEVKGFLKMNNSLVRMAAAFALLDNGNLSGLDEFDKRFRGNDIVTLEYSVLKARIPDVPALATDAMHDAEQKSRLEIRTWLKANAPNLKWDAEKKIYTKSK